MSATTTSRRRWTEEAIEAELRARRDELGRFPTRSDLVACGLRGLWDAMRARGGVEVWQARLEAGPASHQEIAARAYELYASGAAGDSVAHWLAAERDLAS